jgi:hypothetical protein
MKRPPNFALQPIRCVDAPGFNRGTGGAMTIFLDSCSPLPVCRQAARFLSAIFSVTGICTNSSNSER